LNRELLAEMDSLFTKFVRAGAERVTFAFAGKGDRPIRSLCFAGKGYRVTSSLCFAGKGGSIDPNDSPLRAKEDRLIQTTFLCQAKQS
jgi:hypothetical protein